MYNHNGVSFFFNLLKIQRNLAPSMMDAWLSSSEKIVQSGAEQSAAIVA